MVNKFSFNPGNSENKNSQPVDFKAENTANIDVTSDKNLSNDFDEEFDLCDSSVAALIYNSSTIFPWSIGDVADMLQHPQVNGRTKLFNFLREHNIFEERVPLQEYVDLGYFSVSYDFTKPYSIYCIPRTRVSLEGLEFIRKLVVEKLGEYSKTKKVTRSRKKGQLTPLNLLLK